jgi:hypothetical protein
VWKQAAGETMWSLKNRISSWQWFFEPSVH